ncbi:L-glyceraldehyde 3-phosphate reductase [Thiospirochaeta perfilievii]|uniref:L-glyceraldehyde 3-phosphate reductase n=1 Tax=Thiospirochaeta perfilievii TaxID=252967 RepID=A0A5C1Q8Q5_9SPIO|nr:aldo/keto reductase [Thiospirochaeta perfilievii]QEN03881.1 L-glyceraldehyde 3-phosphate reductase [Thiospirochaeta perfilievii]
MEYIADKDRYNSMEYKRCGSSGILLPKISLGLWHNFSDSTVFENSRDMARVSFDLGITHFDLANNYGPPPGSAEENFGLILKKDLKPYRDELIISTKAGYDMWPGPYGNWGSRKYLISSCDQSLKRLGLDYVDVFYHHRPDPDTPLLETMTALDYIVRSGRAMYIGLSNYYLPEKAKEAFAILKDLGTPCLLHQVKYNMFDRRVENGLLDLHDSENIGVVTFSPLEKGILTNKYLNGIPNDSRAKKDGRFLKPDDITDDVVSRVLKLNSIAQSRGQTLAQMSLSWNLRHKSVSSVIIGASRSSQIKDCIGALENSEFSKDELDLIDKIVK